MKRELRKELSLGLGGLAIYLILNRFTTLPDMVLGILMGISFAFGVVGLLPAKIYNNLKVWKKGLFRNA